MDSSDKSTQVHVDLSLESKSLRHKTHRSKINTCIQQLLCVFGPRFPEISVQSPAFPSPKSRPSDSRMPSIIAIKSRNNNGSVADSITVIKLKVDRPHPRDNPLHAQHTDKHLMILIKVVGQAVQP